jgi:putative transcriptional regulator
MHHTPLPAESRALDALLAEYAVGSLPRPMHVLIQSHLEMNPASERFVAGLEAVKGASLEKLEPKPISRREAMLDAILAQGADAPDMGDGDDPLFSPALRRFLGRPSTDIPWRAVMPGVREWTVEDADGVEAKLYWIKAGRTIPSHTHEGQEVTLVLQGGFTDIAGHYARGEVAVADEDVDHRPVADDDADCVCFAVTDAPLRLTGPVASFLRKVFKG